MREQPFAMVPLAAISDKRLTPTQFKVLCALLTFRAKRTDTIWPSREQIAARCGLPLSRISETTTALCKLGWLIKMGEGGRSKACRYQILETPLMEGKTLPEPVTLSGLETLTNLVTVTESETVTDFAQNGDGFRNETVTESVTGIIGRDQEQTNYRPITLSGKPDDACTPRSEIETIALEPFGSEWATDDRVGKELPDRQSDDRVGPSADREGEKAGNPEAERPDRAGQKAAERTAAHELIHYLNAQTGRAYRLVASNVRLVQARLREGATAKQIKAVIDAKVRQWGPDPTMAEYLRPATLFGATKFEQYLGQLSLNGHGASRRVYDARFVN